MDKEFHILRIELGLAHGPLGQYGCSATVVSLYVTSRAHVQEGSEIVTSQKIAKTGKPSLCLTIAQLFYGKKRDCCLFCTLK